MLGKQNLSIVSNHLKIDWKNNTSLKIIGNNLITSNHKVGIKREKQIFAAKYFHPIRPRLACLKKNWLNNCLNPVFHISRKIKTQNSIYQKSLFKNFKISTRNKQVGGKPILHKDLCIDQKAHFQKPRINFKHFCKWKIK